eukprot:scaffold33323_cov24-Attheya_sp.AAC.1
MIFGQQEYIFVFDNSQIVTIMKYSSGKNASRVLKGTASYLRRMFGLDFTTDFDMRSCGPLTYVSQSIPSPSGMRRFEDVENEWDLIKHPMTSTQHSMSPDMTGVRVNRYLSALFKAESLVNIQRLVSSCHQWDNLPKHLECNHREWLQEAARKCCPNLLSKAASFQQSVVSQWNPHQDSLTDLYILPLSLKDDLKTNEVGMIVLEMAVSNGLLIGPPEGPWDLSPDWESITVYVVGDFVSVRNLRGFVDKLATQKGNTFDHKQSQIEIFSNVLSRFVEIAGDWHVGLNIIVTIYSLFYGGFLQAFQKAVRWRQIQSNPTTCYQAGMLLLLFVIAEVERLVYDMVLHDPKTLQLFEHLRDNMDYSVSEESAVDETPSFDYPSEWRPVAFPFE